jgi:acid phosphatase (class A)
MPGLFLLNQVCHILEHPDMKPRSLRSGLMSAALLALVAVSAHPGTAGTSSPAPAGAVSASPGLAVPADPADGLSLELAPLRQQAGHPPQPGSAALQDDLAILRWLQANRTPQMVASTWTVLGRDPIVFSAAIGVDMAKSTPTIARGLLQFLRLVDEADNRIKAELRRPRPYDSHSDLHPCLPPETGFSFPSGHSSWYTAAAHLLADLVPERRERLLEMAGHGAASRVMCGVHYPSDVLAAQRFARAAAGQIIASPQWQAFRRDPAVQAERRQVRQVRSESLPLLVR